MFLSGEREPDFRKSRGSKDDLGAVPAFRCLGRREQIDGENSPGQAAAARRGPVSADPGWDFISLPGSSPQKKDDNVI